MNPRKIVRAVLVKNKGLVVFSLCLTLIQSLLAILLPYLGKREIEIFEGKSSWLPFFHSPAGMFFFFIGAIFLAKGLGTLCGGGERFLDTLARERMAMEMDRHLYKKMETLDAGFLENPKNRRLIFIFFDMGQLPWSVLRFVRTSLGMSLALAGIIPIVALTSLKVLAIVLSFGVIQFMLTRSKMKRENAYRLFKEKALAGTHELMFLLRYHFHQLLSVSGEKQIMPRYFHRRREAVTMEVKEESIKISYALLYSLTENFTLLLTAAFMGLAVLAGEISIGTFTMITLYAVTLQSAISELNQKMSDWYHLRTVMVQLGFFLSMKSRIDETLIDPQAKGEPGEIRLENITFSYPGLMDEERAYISHLVKELNLAGKNREMWSADWELVKEWERLMEDKSREKTILKGLSHTFPAGSITAVVGKNGSGKTTLTRLLMRSYDPKEGNIHLGSTPLTNCSTRAAREHFSLVTQQPFLLENFSLRDNLLLGTPDLASKPTDETIIALLGEMGFAKKWESLEEGLDGLIGDEITLSGGEAQMVVITRALLQRRPFIIIDEGTNQLDAEHELAIMNLLHCQKDHSAVIIITHRMTTAKKADRIAVLDGGRIVQQGTHEELLTEGGLYKHFWNIQVLD